MGTGYWLWYIPLAPGPGGEAHTSIGIVVHDEFHPFDTIRSFEELCDGKWDHLPEGSFMSVGTVEEAAAAAEEAAKKAGAK